MLGDLLGLATALSWAVAVVWLRNAGLRVSAVPLNLFRTTFALVGFIIALALTEGLSIPELTQKEWIFLSLSGLLGITIGDVLYLSALNRLGAGLAAIVDCFYAPAIVVLAFIALGETLSFLGCLGGGLIILAILIGSGAKRTAHIQPRDLAWGVFFGITAQVMMASSVILVKDLYSAHSVLLLLTFRYVFGLVSLWIWAILARKTDGIRLAFSWSPFLKWTVPAAFFGSFFSTYLWFLGFKYGAAPRVAVFNQLSSIFIVILAAIFLKESLSMRKVLAVVIATLGALLVGLS